MIATIHKQKPTTGFSFKPTTIGGNLARVTTRFFVRDGVNIVEIRKRILIDSPIHPKNHKVIRRFRGKWLAEQVILLKEDSLFQISHYTKQFREGKL